MSRNRIKTACVMMTGPDVQMDLLGDSCYDPANPLPIKCPHCTFPDLDFVAHPYLLTKGISSPAETSPAWLGNFLVRERVRRILELVVPNACTFYLTAERKSKKPTPWWLAVPNQKLETPVPKPKPPFCSKCREPRTWSCATGHVWDKMNNYDTHGVDVFKTLDWSGGVAEDQFAETNAYRKQSGLPPLPWSHWDIEAPSHTERWSRVMLSRDLYFSIRLEQLFKRAKVRGQLVRLVCFKEVKPTPADAAWVEEKLKLLAGHGLVDGAKPLEKTFSATKNWFKRFLKRNAKKGIRKAGFAAIEKRHKLTLPQDYKDFISVVGSKSFNGIMEIEGFTASVLIPSKLDFKCYRRGCVPDLDEEQSQIDGIMFATTDHGDAFVFDVSTRDTDYPVFWHDHEQNTLEPFAPNFSECVKRFANKN